jgi:glycosyltransferase involved in cell wall biosynthesis
MPAPLSVIIPCKNERANIAACVASARLVASEILVADSGSTDGTLEYLDAQSDCRVIEREYRTSGDFKNWAIPQASHGWVLILDADERITAPLAAEIKRVLDRPSHDGYWVGRTNHLMGHPVRHTDWARDRVLRLFRRDLGRYEGPSDHGDVRLVEGTVGSLREKLDHYTFRSWEDWIRKLDRYTAVQAAQWHAQGRRPSTLKLLVNPPLRFLRDYVLYRGFLDGAVGLQIAWSSAFYTFLKQARLWELASGLERTDAKRPSASRGEGETRLPLVRRAS